METSGGQLLATSSDRSVSDTGAAARFLFVQTTFSKTRQFYCRRHVGAARMLACLLQRQIPLRVEACSSISAPAGVQQIVSLPSVYRKLQEFTSCGISVVPCVHCIALAL